MKYIEKVIENRFGLHEARVIRILKVHKILDDKKISESALLSLKDTRTILLELYQ
jgi:transcription initiation factor IIE alpha subunit